LKHGHGFRLEFTPNNRKKATQKDRAAKQWLSRVSPTNAVGISEIDFHLSNHTAS
jgi:hypothetical protein